MGQSLRFGVEVGPGWGVRVCVEGMPKTNSATCKFRFFIWISLPQFKKQQHFSLSNPYPKMSAAKPTVRRLMDEWMNSCVNE